MKIGVAQALIFLGSLAAASQARASVNAELTRDQMKQLESVQRAVFAIPTRTDVERFGRLDVWQVADPKRGGDCEDHALAAREKLIALGWPPSSLRIALGWTEENSYHVVLTIDATNARGMPETYVLDSRFAHVETWSALTSIGYRWDRRQDRSGNAWVAIAG